MHYTTRVQILQEQQAAKNKARLDAMAQQANAMKLEGKFPHVANAMTTFLRSCLPTKFPRTVEDSKDGPPPGFVLGK